MPTPLSPVDKSSPVPLYHQVESQLEQAIRDQRYPSGSLLDSEFELADVLGVSRLTLRRAIDSLVDKGMLARERGIGTRVVAPPRVTRNLVAKLTSLHEDLSHDGIVPKTEVLRLETVPCPEISVPHFEVAPDTPMLMLERLRWVEGRPIALMWNVFPDNLFDCSKDELESRSLYRIMRDQGVEPRVANQSITAVLPTGQEARLLDIPASSPLLVLERVTYDTAGRIIEHARTRYAADRYSFEMRLVTK